MKTFLAMAMLLSVTGCQTNTKSNSKVAATVSGELIEKPSLESLQNYETAYFASGCFWCVEAVFESVKGVKEVISGYSGGKEKNPTTNQNAPAGGGIIALLCPSC